MRHRASRPLIDLWHRVPPAIAHLLGEVARLGPVRALVAPMVALVLGTGAYVAVASVIGGVPTREGESASQVQSLGPTPSDDGERPTLTPGSPTSDGRTPNSSSPDPVAPSAEQSDAPSPTGDVTSAPGSRSGSVTGLPGTGIASPSTNLSRPRVTAKDVTPPQTSLSKEFPNGDAARFSFSASEPASFTCSLDGSGYGPCASPAHYSDLSPGWHTFAVRATDAAGNVDPSPAAARWLANEGGSGKPAG